MRFLSVCSGIEAASVAWGPLGWKAAAFSEIEPFPCALLKHHYPDTPNLGDMTKYKDWPDDLSIDLLCGGTPCQSFSVAGLRKGLDDPRGNLMLTFGAIAAKYRPQWLVWENVPGVLSSNGGADFGAFLGMLGELGYGFAYRVLDAQYFGVAQRRRRVFVVGCLGDWRSAAAVLFERHSVSGHPAPSRQAGKGTTHSLAPSLTASGRGVERCGETRGQDPVVAVSPTLRAGGNRTGGDRPPGTDVDTCETLIPVRTLCIATGQAGAEIGADMAPTLNCNHEAPYVSYGIRTANTSSNGWGIQEEVTHTLDGSMGIAIAHSLPFDTTQITSKANYSNPKVVDPCHQLAARAHVPAIAFQERGRAGGPNLEIGGDLAFALTAPNGGGRAQERNIATAMQVRRLTPVECARLQGFPDNYLDITVRGKPAADGPKYKALGNSWAVPNVRWIGERIDAVAGVLKSQREVA